MKQVNPQNSMIVVFTGAGASATLGKPTTPEFISMLKNRWKGTNTLISRCRNYLVSNGLIEEKQGIDSEILRDWLLKLRDTAEDLEILLENQPYDTGLQGTKVMHKFISTIITEFDSIIRSTYGDIPPQQAYNQYSHLLNTISHHNIHFIPFFTTNYDLVLESMEDHPDSDWTVERGIRIKGIKVTLDEQRFAKVYQNQKTLHLFKLHGSTDWWKNNQTGEIEYFQFGHTPQDTNEYRDLLIYPTREKFEQVKDEPFSFFYNMLESYLTHDKMRLCIVIGYSFRDKKINELFKPSLERGLRFLVIDNGMRYDNLAERLEISDIQDRVRILNVEFGKWTDRKLDDLSSVLNDELNNAQKI